MDRTPQSPPPSPDVSKPKRRNACSDEPRKPKTKREYIFFEIRKPSPINFDDDDEGMVLVTKIIMIINHLKMIDH